MEDLGDEGVEEEASGVDLGADPRGPIRSRRDLIDRFEHVVRPCRIGRHGAIEDDRAEGLVLLMVEGVPATEAWRAMGRENNGTNGAIRRKLERDPVFRARLGALMEERVRDEALGPLGEALAVARSVYRMARLSGDLKETLKAAELVAKLAIEIGPVARGEPEPVVVAVAEPVEKRPAGRPPAVAKQAVAGADQMRARLLELGMAPVQGEA